MSISDVRKRIREEEARRKGGSSSSSKPASASSGESISDRVARIKSESKLGEALGIQKNTNERIDYVNSGIYQPGVSRDMGMTAAGLAHLGKRAGDVINTLGIYGNRYGEAGKIAQEQAGVATSPAGRYERAERP